MLNLPSRYPNRLILAFLSFLVLIVIGASGYHWLEGMSLVDSLYMTVITVSTVGFGEVRQLSPLGRVFTIGLIIGGGVIVAYALSASAEFFMSGEWHRILKIRRQSRMLSKLGDHVIVCGFGRVGRRVSDELTQEGVPFVVVDIRPDRVTHAEELDYVALEGNAANEHILKQAGIERARALVAAVNSDAENVFIILTARSLNSDMLIIARANYEDSEPKMVRAGADRTIVPYEISGKRMVTMLVRPSVADFLDEVAHVSGLELLLEQIRIEPDSPLAGRTISETNFRNEMGVAILACQDSQGVFDMHPGPQTLIEPNGLLLVLGTREQLRDMIKYAKGA
ncbi:MAG TPA: potassium channel protein [Anaerolineales bacterium]|nr:potassium channel protein [Anaerolineales bacterium]